MNPDPARNRKFRKKSLRPSCRMTGDSFFLNFCPVQMPSEQTGASGSSGSAFEFGPELIQFFQAGFVLAFFQCEFLAFYRTRVYFFQCQFIVDLCISVFQAADFVLGFPEVIFTFAFFRLQFFLLLPA